MKVKQQTTNTILKETAESDLNSRTVNEKKK